MNDKTLIRHNGKMPEKREIKGYKIQPSVYGKAMRRAKKEKAALATLIEGWVKQYSKGAVFFVDSSIK